MRFLVTLWAIVFASSCAANDLEAVGDLAGTYHQAAVDLARAGDLNGIVLVAQGDEIVFEDAFGVAQLDPTRVLTIENKSRVASVTKQFTAASVLLLAEQGKLSLDDTVGMHLPDYPRPNADRITLRQLLNHSSGLPRPERDTMRETAQTSARDRLANFSTLPLDFTPGTQHQYSNSGYIVLGAIIEEITGETYPDAVRQLILEPVGLEQTIAAYDGTTVDRLASDLQRSNGEFAEDDYRISDRGAPFSAGMIVSTVRDLAKWTRALHAGEVFADSGSYDTMLATPGRWEDNRAFDQWAYASGLFHARRDNGREFVFHDGRLGAYLADLRYYPALDVTIVVLETANGDVTKTADAMEDIAFANFAQPGE